MDIEVSSFSVNPLQWIGCGLDIRGSMVRLRAKARYAFPLQILQTDAKVILTSSSKGNSSLFPQGYNSRSVNLITHPFYTSEVLCFQPQLHAAATYADISADGKSCSSKYFVLFDKSNHSIPAKWNVTDSHFRCNLWVHVDGHALGLYFMLKNEKLFEEKYYVIPHTQYILLCRFVV